MHAEAIRLNDDAHEAVVGVLLGRREADAELRQLLMRALEFAEDAWQDNPKAHCEQVIALVNLDLFAMLQDDGSHRAYARAIQDALQRAERAFDGTPSSALEISRFGHLWYVLGFQQQALGSYHDAIALYQMASQTVMAVPESERDIRLLVLIGTATATCADCIGLDELASSAREKVEDLMRVLEG